MQYAPETALAEAQAAQDCAERRFRWTEFRVVAGNLLAAVCVGTLAVAGASEALTHDEALPMVGIDIGLAGLAVGGLETGRRACRRLPDDREAFVQAERKVNDLID